MLITARTTFLHDVDRYEEGKQYDVADVLAGYLIGNGWATGPDGANTVTRAGATHDVQPDNVRHDQESN